ncbi:MAG: S8 family serine peptidase, partial [Acidobacteria bacterium]|nr:S8 family serine peptidase [Acidobacteriota bacterium]
MHQRPVPSWPGKRLLLLPAILFLLPGLIDLALSGISRQKRDQPGSGQFESARDFGFVQPLLHERPEGLSPLESITFDPDLDKLAEKDTLFTSTGVFRVSDPGNQNDFPSDLRLDPSQPAAGAGLRPGALNYALLNEEGRLRSGEVEGNIARAGGRVVGLVKGGYILWVPARGIRFLSSSGLFSAFSPLPPAHKIFADVGRKPLIQKARAGADHLRLLIEVVSGVVDRGQVEKRLSAHTDSVREVGEHFGLRTYEAIATTARIKQIANLPWVFSIREEYEWVTRNYETVPTLQVGSWEDRQFETPFWAVGLDGTGEIVAVSDNGISLDSPQFSHTSTDPGTIFQINFFPRDHRKIVRFELLSDGLSCDNSASGGGTHGNVVAGLIAGNATEAFGFAATYQPNRAEVLTGINMDGLAKGARLVFQDIGSSTTQCTSSELVEVGGNVTVPFGDIIQLMTTAFDEGARLHVLPFAIPNMDSVQFANCVTQGNCSAAVAAGTYTAESRQLDTFLANHLEAMAFLPASNNGGEYPRAVGRLLNLIPDLFDGDLCNNNVDNTLPGFLSCPAPIGTPEAPVPLMIDAPATAKNDITVGAGRADEGNLFGTFNGEENIENFVSKGPETAASLRMGPTIVTVGTDDSDVFGGPNTWGLAVLSSLDNDQAGPVQGPDTGLSLVLDDGNSGTSFAAATATAMGAIIRQYFADGFYPTGTAVPGHEISTVSGALVKAMLVMMTNYMDVSGITTEGVSDNTVSANRCGTFLGNSSTGSFLGVIGNNEQGCGRPILSQGLPLANYPDDSVYPLIGPGTPEQAAAGLVVYDFVATGEPVFTGLTVTKNLELFPSTGQLRCTLAWIDPPDMGSGGVLINDLNLRLLSPSGTIYHGNVYSGAWAQPDPDPLAIDDKNPFEAIQIDSPEPGSWTAEISGIPPIGNSGPNEDLNGNFRLDGSCAGGNLNAGSACVANGNCDLSATGDGLGSCVLEDTDLDGLLDLGGQPFALVCSGPLLTPPQSILGGGTHVGTGSLVRWDQSRYGCREDVTLRIFDGSLPSPTEISVSEAVIIEVLDATGTLVETERLEMSGLVGGSFSSVPLSLRESLTAVPGNGLLEVEDRFFIKARYLDPDGEEAVAIATIDCRPNLLASKFTLPGESDQQGVVSGGCDNDPYLDAGEIVTFSVAICNESNRDDFSDVTATLSVLGGPASGVVHVVDPQKRIGRLPPGSNCGVPPLGSGFQAVTFSLSIDPSAQALVDADESNGWVELELRLDAVNQDLKLESETFTFRQAVVADKEIFKFSTDFPDGSSGIAVDRDLNRDGLISLDSDNDNIPDLLDNAIDGVEERIVFDAIPRIALDGQCSPDNSNAGTPCSSNGTCLSGTGPARCIPVNHTGNLCSEDLNGNGLLDPGEDVGLDGVLGTGDIGESNRALDRCMYGDVDGISGTPDDFMPWSFDQNDGGFFPERDPLTNSGIPVLANAWENITTGTCGFQSVLFDPDPASGFQNLGAGVWHTGDGLSDSLAVGGDGNGQVSRAESNAHNATICRNYSVPIDPGTVPGTEILVDVLQSPVIVKVNQGSDVRGFPFLAEFRRLAFNLNAQIADDSSRLIIDIDSDIDEHNQNVLVAENDGYSEDRAPHDLFQVYGPLDPTDNTDPQDTFGPFQDPDGSAGEDTGCDNMANTGDFGEQDGILQTEDLGCDLVETGPQDPLEKNSILDSEDANGDGILQAGEDIGCDRITANCAAGQPGEDANFDLFLSTIGACDPDAIRSTGVFGDPDGSQIACTTNTPCEMGLCDPANLNAGQICRANSQCDLQFIGDGLGTCLPQGPGTLSCIGFEDIGCDGILATCFPTGGGNPDPPGEAVESEVNEVVEVEPNDTIFDA